MVEWKTISLGQLCTIKPPKSEAKAKLVDDDEVSFAPMEDLGIGVKYLQPKRTRRLSEVSGSYTYFANGDVLLAKITPCFENGKLGVARELTNGVGFGSSEYIVLRPTPALDAEFLYYYLARPTFLEEGARTMTGAVGHKRVTKEFVETYPIPLPPLPEQRRIVAILDEAFEGIATAKVNTERNLQNAREIFSSYLQDVYTVRVGHLPRERLEVLCEKSRLITYGVVKLGDPIEGGVPCLRTSNVRWLDIDINGMKRISPTLAAEYSRTILRGGEVLVNVRGTLGGVAVVPDYMAGWNVSREVAVVPVNADILDPEYAAFWIGSRASQNWLSGVKKGAAYTGINIEDLRNLPVPLPEKQAQHAIVNDVLEIRDATRRMEVVYQNKIAALDELKQSMLHQAFNGGLAKGRFSELAEAMA
jgi:type I restriction enzyme, S subunit